MSADLHPGLLAGLLHLIGVLDPELPGGLQSALLPLGPRQLTGRELLQQLRDGGAALSRKNPQPVTDLFGGLDARRLTHTGDSTAGRIAGAIPISSHRGSDFPCLEPLSDPMT